MTVSKITTPVTPLELIEKTNEIIDNLGQGGGGLSYSATCPAITISSGIASWSVTHNLGTTSIIAMLYNSSGAKQECNIVVSSANAITVSFKASTNVTAGSYTIVVFASGSEENITPCRNIGEVVTSTIPLTDAGLHLLDGALIQGSSYNSFVTYIAGLVNTYPNCFTTESNWQSAVTTYGACGKFVYDSVNNTVRLPKITGFVEGTIDITALGNLISAGLPNITGTYSTVPGSGRISTFTGAFTTEYTNIQGLNIATGSGLNVVQCSFSAANSNSVYGNSNTVQPQAIKVFYYIVIATSIKTDIQVDIDEIATDLNGKADIDLTNTNNTAKVLMSGMGMPSNTSDILALGGTGTTYTAPANGYYFLRKACNASQQYLMMINTTANYSNDTLFPTNWGTKSLILPVKKGDIMRIAYNAGGTTEDFRFIYAVGSESEQS